MKSASIEACVGLAARRLFLAATTAIGLAAGAGCTPPMDRVDLRIDTNPPRAVIATAERVEIEHGIAVAVTALPKAAGESISATLSMTTTEPSIFGIESVIGNQFVFYGTYPGSCRLRITDVSGGSEVDIPVTVVEQPPPP